MWWRIVGYTYTQYKYKTKKYHNVGTIPKSNIKIVDRCKIDTSYAQIHERSLSWLGKGTSIKGDGIKLMKSIRPWLITSEFGSPSEILLYNQKGH